MGKLTKKETEFILRLLKSTKSELLSSKSIGIKVPTEEIKKVDSIEKKIEDSLYVPSYR